MRRHNAAVTRSSTPTAAFAPASGYRSGRRSKRARLAVICGGTRLVVCGTSPHFLGVPDIGLSLARWVTPLDP